MTASTERASALAAWRERFAKASANPQTFSICERPFLTQVNLRGNAGEPEFLSATFRAIGGELPALGNTFQPGTGAAATCLGPDEWLIIDRPDNADQILEDLRAALEGVSHSVTDVSAARTVIEISGSEARLVLAKGCPLALHAAVFAHPRTAQTLLAKARVLIHCTDPAPTFRIFVANSLAAYLAEWIIDAAAECAAARGFDTESVVTRLA